MLINEKRALAYTAKINEIRPIEGYDRVELAIVNGWQVIVSKQDNFKPGDIVIYFEIDSKVPATNPVFSFLEKRDYCIKTLKMCKTVSQGLIMRISNFPELEDELYEAYDGRRNGIDNWHKLGIDVTEELGVTYSEPGDNERKADYPKTETKKNFFFTNPVYKKLKRYKWFRELVEKLLGNKDRMVEPFPAFVSKTDEERIENLSRLLTDTEKEWMLTEKIDGTSATYIVKRKGRKKYEFYVCSRNQRLLDSKENLSTDYWIIAKEYRIKEALIDLLNKMSPNADYIVLQGEIAGPNIQKNPLKLEKKTFFGFNLIVDGEGRYNSKYAGDILSAFDIPWVPILGIGKLQTTMEAVKAFADGQSALNNSVLREGLVYRSLDGKQSFKNVSTKYLMSK